jgi:hypothetical protein
MNRVGARDDPIPRLSQAPRQVVTATVNLRYRLADIGELAESLRRIATAAKTVVALLNSQRRRGPDRLAGAARAG